MDNLEVSYYSHSWKLLVVRWPHALIMLIWPLGIVDSGFNSDLDFRLRLVNYGNYLIICRVSQTPNFWQLTNLSLHFTNKVTTGIRVSKKSNLEIRTSWTTIAVGLWAIHIPKPQNFTFSQAKVPVPWRGQCIAMLHPAGPMKDKYVECLSLNTPRPRFIWDHYIASWAHNLCNLK